MTTMASVTFLAQEMGNEESQRLNGSRGDLELLVWGPNQHNHAQGVVTLTY
jgi:hypothetical protein